MWVYTVIKSGICILYRAYKVGNIFDKPLTFIDVLKTYRNAAYSADLSYLELENIKVGMST